MSKRLSREYIGPLSSATMRAEDLIPKFMAFLDGVAQQCRIVRRVKALQADVDRLKLIHKPGYHQPYYADDDDFQDGMSSAEVAEYILNEDIWSLLDEIAPRHCGFSSHEGDGACYGYWAYCPWCGRQVDAPGSYHEWCEKYREADNG
ncbi:MAG: hypothetical protein A2W25_11625 [candidate division Zixibacteria bacterium RBG_16_53_22]|nr:MAG: hypothetical protein A2W25_11625 [candidate division Zixibacteria bacterium RBG_16_53_22]